ncbi:aldehyde dehydrogenase family protein [Terrihabitans rhizophilus]|uniref:Aldehyde dehydrogenase family protein n=1 Tax=Terrihabitans rhizophilus TaxID=3092662 RepID=A0ABU4RJ18_9HYPH|nr:aldehyde dehydrogenase family protein [Terrihabitans sp. PJ23]MDX6804832.1 aldehyde dehydrogenase family protein [Terrihabitans sp. PJ23]
MNISVSPLAHGMGAATAPKNLLIGGKLVPSLSGRTFETRNPATGELLATVYEGDAEDINLAVAAARRAFEGPWSRFTPFQRQECLLKFADLVEKNFEELARLDTLDMGAPITFARSRKQRAIGMLRFYAGLCTTIRGETLPNSIAGDVFAYTLKEPVGVVGAITPWNAPLTSTLWKIGPVLASGCTMVLKPAEDAPLTALWLGEMAMEAGVPEGVLNVVPGYGHTAGAALSSHMDVDKVAFTGSDTTGRKIIKASKSNFKRVTLELGGKSADIVFADANMDKAVAGAGMAVFINSGQICSAGTRLLVERTVYDEFVERVSRFASGLRVGNGMDPDTQIGPLVSKKQLERVASYIEIGLGEGASATIGGKQMTDGDLSKGYFMAPTVLKGVNNDMRIAQEEIFGPVVSAIPFDTPEEAARLANQSMFGLGGGVWTESLRKANFMAKSIRTGTVWVNCYGLMDPTVPFGGYKASGYGRESGVQHVEEYLQTKSVVIQNA